MAADSRRSRRDLVDAAAALERAEIAELDLDEATSSEVFELVGARGRDRGRVYGIVELVGMVESGADFPAPGPEAVAAMRTIDARSRVRRALGLPQDPCAQGLLCTCLSEALDVVLGGDATVTRRRVLALAKAHHRGLGTPYVPPPEPEPIREVAAVDAADPEPEPEPEPKPEPRRERRAPSERAWRSKRGRDEAALTRGIENYKF